MNIARTGIIINTENYAACVAFYRDTFALPVIFEESDGETGLTCFDFGGSYLMIETGGMAIPGGKSMAQNASKIRFNVADIDIAAKELEACGIKVSIIRNDWGSTINLFDPDGNPIGIRDESTFAAQLIRYTT